MLEFNMDDGSVWLVGNLISLAITAAALYCLYYLIYKQKDKALHMAVSAVGTFLFLSVVCLAGYGQRWWWTAPVLAMILGFGKEIWDKLNPKKKKFDWMDILADAVGVVWVSAVYFISVR